MVDALRTPIGRLCFPNLFEPRPQAPGGEPRFSATLVFDEIGVKTQEYQNLRRAVHAAIVEKFGADKAADPKFVSSLRLPFRDPSEKDYDGFDGEIFIAAWRKGSDTKPGIVDKHGAEIIAPVDVWAGQLASFTVRPFGYDKSGNKGVALGLEHVMIAKSDMPRIDGRRTAKAAFEGSEADVDAQLAAMGLAGDPSTGMPPDDDLPF